MIIPVALVKARMHFHTGRGDLVIIKALLEATSESDGSTSKLQTGLGLPSSVVATLVGSAARNGFLSVDDEGVVLSGSSLRALKEDNVDSFLGCQAGSEACEFAVDLASGFVHDYEWILEHRKSVNGVNDILLSRDTDEKDIPTLLKEKSLRELLQSSSKRQMFTNKEASPRITLENIDKIDDVQVEEVIGVAVPMTENHAGEITRWLVQHDTPRSVIDCLNMKKPELFEIKYELKEAAEKWTPTDATALLDSIDQLWERVQNAPLRPTSSEARIDLARVALGELKALKDRWREQKASYSDVKSSDVWAGPAATQGERLSKFMKRVHKNVVILTSFLNKRYTSWVAEILSNLPKNSHVLILYGHANQETPAEQSAEIQSYKAELLRYLRSDIVLTVGVTTKRTHEKIVVADTSYSMLGSWNICSSNPNSEHFEVNIDVKSRNIASELCSILETEVGDEDSVFVRNLRSSLEKTTGKKGAPLDQRIDWLTAMMEKIAGETVDEVAILSWREWRDQLLGLRDLIWTYYDSPPATIVTTEILRDVFVQLIRSSNSSILVATDRVNYNGLDASLIQHLFEKQRIIRIVWGMESPEWDLHDDPEVQAELDVAAETLRTVVRNGQGNVLTSLSPMLNHSKVVIVDENAVLISSDNFLARGMEPTEESSREIGILVESPLLARQLLGQLMLHSEHIRGRIDLRQRAGQPWDLFELIRESVEDVWTDDGIKDYGRPDLVNFAVQSTFREFTADGKIVGEDDDQYRPTDESLSSRWEICMRFFGKGRVAKYTGSVLPTYEEYFFTHASEMIGIQRVMSKGVYTIRPRSPMTFVLLPRFMRKGGEIPPSRYTGEVYEPQLDEEEVRGEMLYNLRIGRERSEEGRETDLESG